MNATKRNGVERVVFGIAFLGAGAGGLCVVAILACYSIEVFMRYVLNAPTSWASDYVTYFLCASVFLTMPQLTREGSHVAVTVLQSSLPAVILRLAIPIGLSISAFICFFVGWLALKQTHYNFVRGIDTMSLAAVPKWTVAAPIAYGFLLSGIVLLLKLRAQWHARHEVAH
ncbi:TRAP transporter small permease [Pseudohoeflea coraliihabitans]|uniref:TRAP transporter small permease protein n=1 Tax=Pseudohoeflea coraliihabitans TaxID=2860393 RepID=A0ABS6WMY2_9HYPH|nr:TRAP transporter small permease [Pseudohoeflea sp. DP4N28-3]MBW3097255.1 TRAP transporter small permease [Pseudohoeflea sp. DP4N28-3]